LYIIHLFFNPFLTSVIYTLSLHDALPISPIYLTNRSLGAWNTNTNNIVHYFGLWSWEGDYTSGAAQVYTNHFDPLWIPDLTRDRSEEHTSELQSRENLVCRLLLEKKKKKK